MPMIDIHMSSAPRVKLFPLSRVGPSTLCTTIRCTKSGICLRSEHLKPRKPSQHTLSALVVTSLVFYKADIATEFTKTAQCTVESRQSEHLITTGYVQQSSYESKVLSSDMIARLPQYAFYRRSKYLLRLLLGLQGKEHSKVMSIYLPIYLSAVVSSQRAGFSFTATTYFFSRSVPRQLTTHGLHAEHRINGIARPIEIYQQISLNVVTATSMELAEQTRPFGSFILLHNSNKHSSI